MNTINQLSREVSALQQSAKDIDKNLSSVDVKIDSIADKVNSLDKKIYAATAIISIVVAVGCYFGNKAIDFGLEMAKRPASVEAPPKSRP